MDGGFTLGDSADFDGVDDDLIFQRIDSGEIIYSNPSAKYKLVGPYVIGNKLGEGSYAKVKECLHSETLQRCAVKIMKQKTLRKIPHGTENVKREIKLLRNLKHNNVIRLLDVHYNEEKGKIYMMMEYCVAGLQEMLDRSPEKKFPIWQAHGYFVQLLDGLQYLHSRGVVHKDVKPGNLLLTCDHTLKITDFGVAEQVEVLQGNDLITCSQGSPMFQPPEVAGGSHTHYPGYKLDVWSSGCTLFNFTSGKYPFNGSNIFRIFESVCHEALVVPSDLDESLGDLLQQMLNKDPFKRISLQEAKTHRWVQQSHPRDPEDEGVSVWGKRGVHDPHQCSVIPFLQCHHFPDETRPYITEREINAAEAGMAVFESADNSKTASNTRRKRRKPTSCITFKSLANCNQS
uniref:non-specific serine/threonine protein kinase n=2 Tax=Hirondellea gigas TaxID=1518452 RepID=A0A6A7FRR0_9CRUS